MLRSSLASPIRQSTSLFRAQLLTRPIQRSVSTTPSAMPIVSNISTPLKSQYTTTERRVVGLATFTVLNACVGAGLYYYISQSEGQISGSYAKKNAHVDRKNYDGRSDTRKVFALNKVD